MLCLSIRADAGIWAEPLIDPHNKVTTTQNSEERRKSGISFHYYLEIPPAFFRYSHLTLPFHPFVTFLQPSFNQFLFNHFFFSFPRNTSVICGCERVALTPVSMFPSAPEGRGAAGGGVEASF